MLVAEGVGDLSPVFLAVAVELILPAAGIVEGLVDRADLRVRQGGREIVENLLRDLRVGDEETLEVLQLEEGGEDYLGFNIGFERPEGSTPQKTEPAVILPSIPIVSVEQVSLEVTPQEYFKPDIRRFSIDDPAPFRLSVDVLNYGLREEYLGKHYGAWMKGAFEFTANNTAYMIWFPIADKKSDPSKVVTLEKVAPMLDELAAIIEGFNKLIRENNAVLDEKPGKQAECKTAVWEHIAFMLKDEVTRYKASKAALEKDMSDLTTIISTLRTTEIDIAREITDLNKGYINTSATIDSVNMLLRDSGFQGFSIREKTDMPNVYEVVRPDGSIAENLSEGERNFIAFLYFYHQVKGSESADGGQKEKIVVIDDPVSSMDSSSLADMTVPLSGSES